MPAYWPFVQIFRSLLEAIDDEQLAETIRAGDADLIPLVLVLEDLHWADRDSMRLTSFLAGALSAGTMIASRTS